MSCYLTIRKKGVELCSFSRNTDIYEALNEKARFDEWSSCDLEALNAGYEYLKDEIFAYNQKVNNENKALQFLRVKEDIYEAIEKIEWLQEEIRDKTEALNYISFLIHVWHQNGDGEMEWTLG